MQKSPHLCSLTSPDESSSSTTGLRVIISYYWVLGDIINTEIMLQLTLAWGHPPLLLPMASFIQAFCNIFELDKI